MSDKTKNVITNNHLPTLTSKGDLSHIISANGAKEPAMRGFDPKFQDIVDYIVKITHEIWEGRAIGALYKYYGTNMRIHTSEGDIHTRDAVIAGTIQALAAFPDRRLYADECIWKGSEELGYYYSSHRLTHEGTNWGHTEFGPPTNKRVQYRAVADCKVVEGVIVEEWLARDNLTLVAQLGYDPHTLAQQMALADAELGVIRATTGDTDRLRGQLAPSESPEFSSNTPDIEKFVLTAIHEIWNRRMLNKVDDLYSPQFICESASKRFIYGRRQYQNYILTLLSPFPDLTIHVEHFCALPDGENRHRTATRWRMVGTHTGPGVYGNPTGNPISIMGMTHHFIENGKFTHEWTVFDEFVLLKQIYKPK